MLEFQIKIIKQVIKIWITVTSYAYFHPRGLMLKTVPCTKLLFEASGKNIGHLLVIMSTKDKLYKINFVFM